MLLEAMIVKEHDSFRLNLSEIKRFTNDDFHRAVMKNVKGTRVTHVKFANNDDLKCVYICMAGNWYSFTHDEGKQQYWFARKNKNSWKMIIGYQIIEENMHTSVYKSIQT